jgi:hypothetical protein
LNFKEYSLKNVYFVSGDDKILHFFKLSEQTKNERKSKEEIAILIGSFLLEFEQRIFEFSAMPIQ